MQGPREGRHSTCGSSLQTPYVWIFQSQEQNGKSDRPIQATPATTPRTAARASQSYRISTILTITVYWSQDTQKEDRRATGFRVLHGASNLNSENGRESGWERVSQ